MAGTKQPSSSTIIRPLVDSVSAIQIQNAAGTVQAVFDTTNGRFGVGTSSPDTSLQVVGTTKVGEDTTNYTQTESDGSLRYYGTATRFDDLLGAATKLKVVGTGIVEDAAENSIKFQTAANLSDYAYDTYQVPHKWVPGSVVHPHFHFEQTENNIPNFLIRYRWQINGGAKTTAWTNYICKTPVFTYVSGTLNQIAKGAGITPPVGYNISDNLQMRFFRDNANTSTVFTGADPFTTDVQVTSIDVHIEINDEGSTTEYAK